MAEAHDQKYPETTDPRLAKSKSKAGGHGRSRGQYVTQSLRSICDARGNRSGNQANDRAQPQQKSNLLG
jgi:hypothetical protein